MCKACESLGKDIPLQWIEQYQRWYCYECKQYTPVSNSNVDTSTAKIETNRSVLFCSKCGKETLPEATYCGSCGNPLTLTQNNSSKTGQFTLLPNENVMLSLKDAKLEQKETVSGSVGSYMKHDARARTLENRTGLTHGEAMNATYEPPKLDRVRADNLLITNKRMIFIDKSRSIREIIIDKEYAREVLHARRENNRRAMREFNMAWAKASAWERMRGKVKREDFGYVSSPFFLLKNAERKDRIMRSPEVQLDFFEFGSSFHSVAPKALNLTFSDIEQLSDKLLNLLKPSLAVISDYVNSQQCAADYNS